MLRPRGKAYHTPGKVGVNQGQVAQVAPVAPVEVPLTTRSSIGPFEKSQLSIGGIRFCTSTSDCSGAIKNWQATVALCGHGSLNRK